MGMFDKIKKVADETAKTATNNLLDALQPQSSPQKENVRNAIVDDMQEESIKSIICAYQEELGKDLYWMVDIPEKKLSNAMDSYTVLDDDERIICLYDNTVFGSAKEGFVLSTKGLYWKNSFENSNYLCYCDVKNIKEGKNCIYIDGEEISLSILDSSKIKSIQMLLTAASQYAKGNALLGNTVEKWITIAFLKEGEITEEKKIELYKKAKPLGFNFDRFESTVDETISSLPIIVDSDAGKGGVFDNFGNKIIGRQAILDYKEAKKIKAESDEKYNEYSEKTTEVQQDLNRSIEEYGRRKLETLKRTLGVFLSYLERMEQKYKESYYELMDGCDFPKAYVTELGQLNMNNNELLKTAITTGGFSYAAVAGVPAAVTGAVGALATASTGTAITSLSGAAASNAILAWLGGGSIAAGGGGIAAGTVVLAGITYSVTGIAAIAASGLVASSIFAKKLTQTHAYSSEVDIACEKMETSWVAMDGIKQRVSELMDVTMNVYDKCIIQLSHLEPIVSNFDTKSKEHLLIFQKSALLVKSMSELAKTPLFGDDMNLSEQSEAVITKTRKILNTEL